MRAFCLGIRTGHTWEEPVQRSPGRRPAFRLRPRRPRPPHEASTGEITPDGVASWKQMSKSPHSRFPVTVTRLPVTRCQVCHHTVAYRPGAISEALTEHYRRAHPEALDLASG